jgi:hypothetical protein
MTLMVVESRNDTKYRIRHMLVLGLLVVRLTPTLPDGTGYVPSAQVLHCWVCCAPKEHNI